MFLHSDRFLLQTVRVFFLIFFFFLKVFLFPIWSVLPSFSTSETSVLILEKFVYEARIDGYKEFVYNSRNNQIAKYILCKLEKFEYGLTVDRDDTTLEHILPDNPDESWEWDDSAIQQYKYRLGNMALLEKGKNSDLGNASYLEKKDVYSKSSIPSTKKIGDTVNEWSESIITTRQQKMSKIAKGIWQI